MATGRFEKRDVPRFDRSLVRSERSCSRIGDGEIGGKARGLVFIREVLDAEFGPNPLPGLEVNIPTFVVITTDVFDAFLDRNDLREIASSDLSDDRIAHAFLRGDLPVEILGDLRAITEEVRSPLAVRSSSLLEDALFHPFAGIYETKMTPNNQPDPHERFRRVAEAVKLVYASTFFRAAKSYIRATDKSIRDEKMAVILQEVVGAKHGERFYPTLSGVCRSYNFYPNGGAKPEDGVAELALGLGKTIVDGGLAYIYSPARPKAPPPYSGVRESLQSSQTSFWAVNVGKPPPYDPAAEKEFLLQADLETADYDGTLVELASTYVAASDRIIPGTGHDGPRIIDFAPLLQFGDYPFNEAVRRLLASAERAVGAAVEIEFAVNLPPRNREKPARVGFLQVRPMVVSEENVTLTDDELEGGNLVLASDRIMGNGLVDAIQDIVYVRPEPFETRHTRTIAAQLERMNGPLLEAGRPYLLVGFGRWGSSDSSLGIPVKWGQISGAKVIVEATLPSMAVEASQGSHFFHNMTSFRVGYFYVSHLREPGIDWTWLGSQEVVSATEYVQHVHLDSPLLVKLDGRRGRGAIWRTH